MVVFRDIEVTVQVDGQSLKEYNNDEADENPTPNVVTKYIEAISDAKFAIFIKLLDGFEFASDGLLNHVYVDGAVVRRPILVSQQRSKEHSWRSVLVEGHEEVENGRRHLRRPYFSGLSVLPHDVSREAELEQYCQIQKKGIISVQIFEVKLFGDCEEKTYTSKNVESALEQTQQIGKKARVKTGLTHTSKLGGRESVANRKTWSTSFNEHTSVPIAIFNFKYRSEDALKSLQVIPRTPSPEPLEERPIDTLTSEEMREMLQRHRARDQIKKEQERGAEAIKRERDDEVDEILASAHAQPAKKSRMQSPSSAEIVDLTD